MMRLQILIFISYIIMVQGEAIINRCSGPGILPDVILYPSGETGEPCKQNPCEVKPGSQVYLSINFTSPGYLENITPKVLATIPSGLQINYSFGLHQDNACDGLRNTVCPIVENEELQYGLGLQLETWFPKIGVSLEFSIVDKDVNANVICFVIDVHVV